MDEDNSFDELEALRMDAQEFRRALDAGKAKYGSAMKRLGAINTDPRLIFPLRFRISWSRWTTYRDYNHGEIEIAYGIHIRHKFYFDVRVHSFCLFIGWSP